MNERLPHMHAVDRDLTPFKKSGGKLIAYAGWMDPVVPPQDTAAYYEGVAKVMGGYDKTRDFFRLFMAPGMGHCAGGPGPEHDSMRSPRSRMGRERHCAGQVDRDAQHRGKVDRTRPLCPYPQVARYTGKGSMDEAANFACVAPQAPPAKTHQQRLAMNPALHAIPESGRCRPWAQAISSSLTRWPMPG